uniref:DNA-directed RNA polymerases I, II, and III subunit RPABC1 n=1 Tax=Hirondellea gigas TaxID=1518452 RepID=A0A6A7GBA5_9CRUS
MEQYNPEYSRQWRVHRTLCQMLRDRSYVVEDTLMDLELSEFVEKFESIDMAEDVKLIRRDDLTLRVVHESNADDVMFVFFSEETKVGVPQLQVLMRRLVSDGAKKAIIIIRETITPFAKKVLLSLPSTIIVEQFQETELLVNITRHVLVPQHILLEEHEKKMLLEKYHLKDTQLPRIQKSDPVARYYGLLRGQVVKIVRPSETAGRYVTYRLVV